MENLKIRVNSEDESKEAQELFFELGYEKGACSTGDYPALIIATPESRFQKTPYSSRATSLNHEAHSQYKEITLPELRDLVILNRNDAGDATHTDPNEKESLHFRLFGEWWNLFTGGKWQQFCHMESPRAVKLKPIEKPMKEYLRKNNDGEYILEVTNEREAQEPHAKHWIEVPKGCDYLISVFGVNSFIDSDMFAKFKTKNVLWSRKPMKEYLNKLTDGTYKLVVLSDVIDGHDGLIEIPEGAEIYIDLGFRNHSFYKDNFKLCWCGVSWENTVHNSMNLEHWNNTPVLWKRHTIPEELPFIDDESKEYLRKNSDGTYSYIGTVQPDHVSNFMIEIPEGCNIITCEERKCGLVHFHWKSLDSDEFFLKDEKIWSNNFNETLFDFIEKNEGDVKIIWSRYTHPEELPFVDDECYTNKSNGGFKLPKDKPCDISKWVEIRATHPEALPFIDNELKITTAKDSELDYIAKIHDMRDRYDGESDEDYRYQLEHYISRKEPSLNDQYAEIETVRQSAWQKQEGGSHYKNLKIQPMQYALENKLDYAQANVVKYVTRHADKNGKEDLLKAIHNLELMIEFYYGDEK